jgi:hypothetical protein
MTAARPLIGFLQHISHRSWLAAAPPMRGIPRPWALLDGLGNTLVAQIASETRPEYGAHPNLRGRAPSRMLCVRRTTLDQRRRLAASGTRASQLSPDINEMLGGETCQL